MSKQMTIEGIFYHVQAIIEQGRGEEFLKACGDHGFITVDGPDGLIAFTRDFIGTPSSPSGFPTFNESSSDKFKTTMSQSLRVDRSRIDICGC